MPSRADSTANIFTEHASFRMLVVDIPIASRYRRRIGLPHIPGNLVILCCGIEKHRSFCRWSLRSANWSDRGRPFQSAFVAGVFPQRNVDTLK